MFTRRSPCSVIYKRLFFALLIAGFLHLACGVSCSGQRTSCTPSCEDYEPALNVQFGEKFMCRCDAQCPLYDDCCGDFWRHCVNGSLVAPLTPILNSQYAEYFGCISPINTTMFYQSYWVVSRCPGQWPQDDIRRKCENVTYETDKMYTMFVNGPGDIVFKNVYCTTCHGIKEHDLMPWILTMWHCKSINGATTIQEDDAPDYNSCLGFEIKPPVSMPHGAHRCFSNYFGTCPVDTPAQQASLCETATSRVILSKPPVVFKNQHCLDCNVNNTNNSWDVGSLKCLLANPKNKFRVSKSFTLLFDFSDHTVSAIEESWFPITSRRVLHLQNCTTWQIYNPFTDACVDLTCPGGQPVGSPGGCLLQRGFISKPDMLPLSSTHACVQGLLPANASVLSTDPEAVWIEKSSGDGNNVELQQLKLRFHWSLAEVGGLQMSFDRLLSNVTSLDLFTSVLCNATSLNVVGFQPGRRWNRTCEGYTLKSMSFQHVSASDGVYILNISGFLYDQEFIHETEFSFDLNESVTVKYESVTLCNPFVGDHYCTQLILQRDDFRRSDTDDGTFIYAISGLPFSVKNVWELPDGSMRVCRLEWVFVLADFSYICSLVSTTMVILALLTYGFFPILRNPAGKAVMNLMASLALAQIVLLVGVSPMPWLCELRALVLHFSWLAVFFWMNVLSFDLAYSLRFSVVPARRQRSGESDEWKIRKFVLYAWGGPAGIVACCFAASKIPGDRQEWIEYGGSTCWIVRPWHAFLVFGLPVMVNIVFNCLMFISMIHTVISNHRRLVAARMAQSARNTVAICIKLGIVTGVTWTFFIAANLVQEPVIWFISVIANSLQGALIGLIFLLKANVRRLWQEKMAHALPPGRCCAIRCRCCRDRGGSTGVSENRLEQLQGVPNGCVGGSPQGRSSQSCDTLSSTPSD